MTYLLRLSDGWITSTLCQHIEYCGQKIKKKRRKYVWNLNTSGNILWVTVSVWFVVWCDAPAAADAAILKINYTQYSLHLRHFIERARKYISPQFRAFFLYDFIFILCVRLFVFLCVVTIRLSAAGATQRILKYALNLHECICIFVRNSGVDRSENKLRNWRIFLQPNSIRRCGRLWMMHIHPHFTFALPTNPTNWLLFIINYFPRSLSINSRPLFSPDSSFSLFVHLP